MLYKNFFRRNRNFLKSQVPQFLTSIFLIILLIITNGSTKDRLTMFASADYPADITGRISLNYANDLSYLSDWESEFLINQQQDLNSWNSCLSLAIDLFNSLLYLGPSSVSSLIRVIAIPTNYSTGKYSAYLYGDVFRENDIQEGSEINITIKFFKDNIIHSNSSILDVAGYMVDAPYFITQELGSSYGFIFVSESFLIDYLSSISIITLNQPIHYLFGVVFSKDFKETTSIYDRLDSFTYSTQASINNTYLEKGLSPHIIQWSLSSFNNRIETLKAEIQSDQIFFITASLPLLFLLVIVIYRSKELTFSYFKKYINKLYERGYENKQILSFFLWIFLFFAFTLAITGIIVFALISFAFSFGSMISFILFSVLISIWVIISTIFQMTTLRSELKKYLEEKATSSDTIVHREGLIHDIIGLAFRVSILVISTSLIFLLKNLIYLSNSQLMILFIVVAIIGMIIFFSPLNQLLGRIIYSASYIFIVSLGKKIFNQSSEILHKLYNTKSSRKIFDFSSLLILFILAPSILVVSDSYYHHVNEIHYNSICGDILIEDINLSLFEQLKQDFNNSQLLPLIELECSSNVSFFFSRPTQFAKFVQYTWEKGSPYVESNEGAIQNLDDLMKYPYGIIISKKMQIQFDISIGDNFTFYIPINSQFVVSHLNETKIDFEVISIIDSLPYLSSKAESWAFCWMGSEDITFSSNGESFDEGEIFHPKINVSYINTAMIKIDETNSLEEIYAKIISSYPSYNTRFIGDSSEIDSEYPVPSRRFKQFITLAITISLILQMLFFIQMISNTFDQTRKSLLQFYTRGILPKHLVFSFTFFVLTQITVFVIMGIPISMSISWGYLAVLSFSGYSGAPSISISPLSLVILFVMISISILLNFIVGYYKINKILKLEKKFGDDDG